MWYDKFNLRVKISPFPHHMNCLLLLLKLPRFFLNTDQSHVLLTFILEIVSRAIKGSNKQFMPTMGAPALAILNILNVI